MKKLSVVVLLFLFVGTLSLQAKKLPTVAAKLPNHLKEVITDQLNYPDKARHDYVEGEVWMKICVNEASVLRVVSISATNPELGEYVKKELSSLYVENPGCKAGQVFYLKVKFDLLEQ